MTRISTPPTPPLEASLSGLAKITNLLLSGLCSTFASFVLTVWLPFELDMELEVLLVAAEMDPAAIEPWEYVR